MFGKLLDQIGPILVAVVILGLVGGGIALVTTFNNSQEGAVKSMMNAAEYRDYTDLDGRDDVLGATVQSFLTNHSADNVCIEVKTGKTTTQYNFTSKDLTTTVKDNQKLIKKACSKKADNAYINPSGTFSAEVTKNDNGVIVMIHFEQQ